MTKPADWSVPDFDNPDSGRLGRIKALFENIYPQSEYGTLASDISGYWIAKLKTIWEGKAAAVKNRDLQFKPADPLSRVERKTVIIVYADSVYETGRPTLETLDAFLKNYFPAVGGLHILPACEIVENRFNDGGFSQVRRDRIHHKFGSNQKFEQMMEHYFSMTDLVLNHVDIDHPAFKRYLEGDDVAGRCFFVYSEKEYQKRLKNGDFTHIFRPRPFPLFTIYRRKPKGEHVKRAWSEKLAYLNRQLADQGLQTLPDEVLNILYLFGKIRNDQMLLDDDYEYLQQFRDWVQAKSGRPDDLFSVSITQETQKTPYIFNADIQTPEDLLVYVLPLINISKSQASSYHNVYAVHDSDVFGESIRALTTFSHVQVDLNTTSFEGLKLLIDDFAWYLQMDLNMLRLDAANFAFKKWGTSCFGLPEVRKLLKVLYLSMDCVAPRNIPNLEVNAPLSSVLKQMADKQAPPPMMYDFHLAGMLPVVFNSRDARPLLEIFKLIASYEIPYESIRFSLDESHDGKSVNGSGGADPLLTYQQRKQLVEIVEQNGGRVKYKSAVKRFYPLSEFKKVCREARLDTVVVGEALFENFSETNDTHQLKTAIQTKKDIASALKMTSDQVDQEPALDFFVTKIIQGREPYELCSATRDVLYKIDQPELEVRRYTAFKTLALALMGRNVKALYFNDLLGLGNDAELVARTGELRNIKRTKSEIKHLTALLEKSSSFESRVAMQLNNLIALVDNDPAFNPRGSEAKLTVDSSRPAVAMILNAYEAHYTLVIVNTSEREQAIDIQLSDFFKPVGGGMFFDNLKKKRLEEKWFKGQSFIYQLAPFEQLWIKKEIAAIPQELLLHAD